MTTMQDIPDFNQEIDRSGTNALAVEGYQGYLFRKDPVQMRHAPEDLIHMWVADMALATPPAVIDAVKRRLEHPLFGYTGQFDGDYADAFCAWTQERYGWSFKRSALRIATGVIPALYSLVELLCKPGEKVLTLTPAYGYFAHAARANDIELATCPLAEGPDGFRVDPERFRQAAADPKTTLFFLCHPHNPTGRLWSPEELAEMAEICFEHDVFIVSDEIHCDLLRSGLIHTPLARLFPESKRIVTCMAPSKTFNMAGFQIANVIIPDADLRKRWKRKNLPFYNPLSLAAARGAYADGGPWLEALRAHLDQNFATLQRRLTEALPRARFRIPEATYLAWVDLGAYFDDSTNLTRFFAERAGLLLEGGDMFVADGGLNVRLNIACPQQTLEAAIQRLVDAIHRAQKP
ncbi:MAG: PatB family C-S lyase [Acidobacteriota bacterium]